jgi:hypothetical protein
MLLKGTLLNRLRASLHLSIATIVVLCGASSVFAERQPGAVNVTGEWKVELHADHVIAVGMKLVQERQKVTGTLFMWNGDAQLEGEIIDGTLHLTGVHRPNDGMPEQAITMTSKDDGTLAGRVVSTRGKMELTAERFKKPGALLDLLH